MSNRDRVVDFLERFILDDMSYVELMEFNSDIEDRNLNEWEAREYFCDRLELGDAILGIIDTLNVDIVELIENKASNQCECEKEDYLDEQLKEINYKKSQGWFHN